MTAKKKVAALRLLNDAIAKLDDTPGSPPAALAATLERIIAGELPERGSVGRTQTSARIDADILEQARKAAEARGWGLAAAVDEILLGKRDNW